jgi:hypothetical protein
MVLANWTNDLTGLVTVSCLFGGGFLTAIVTAIAVNWRKVKCSEHLAALKQSLADRGMSVEEIERVVNAGPEAVSPREPKLVAEFTEMLVDVQGLSPEDLEKLLEIFQGCDAATQRTILKTVSVMWPGDGSSIDPQKLLAAVRALARSPAKPGALNQGFAARASRFPSEL